MQTRHSGGIAIIDLTGPLEFGPAVDTLQEALAGLVETGHRFILINFDGSGRVDSAGLGTIVGAYASVVKRGGTLHLLKPGKRLREMLRLTQTASLFAIDDDEASAIARFNAPEAARRRKTLAEFLDET